MARAAEKDSDYCIVTSDNPRSEEPEAIIREIEKGFAGRNYEILADRREAIKRAIALARGRDIVLIAGKGHEDYQIFKDETVTFDDRVEARKAIEIAQRKEERSQV
jgi:UDP-N-acetylmuramoyl-L-alanyl-D-glutamate--2,6-diaminopimelate ligase